MIPYKDLKEIFLDITNDKYMKWIVRILGTAITVFVIIEMIVFRIDANNGKHVKLPFFEEGSDTVIKIKKEVVYVPKHDTVEKIKYVKSLPPVNNTSIDHPDKVEIGTNH